MSFLLLDKKNKLIILVLIEYAVKNIEKSIMYINLSISIYKTINLYINISKI